MGKSVLTLDTLEPDRDFITINKQAYYLRADDELSLTEVARIRRASKEIADKQIGIDSTEEDMARVEGFANNILGITVMDLPPEIRDKLSTSQKFSIIRAFTTVASKRTVKVTEGGGPESQPISDGSSPGSEGSTEASSPAT